MQPCTAAASARNQAPLSGLLAPDLLHYTLVVQVNPFGNEFRGVLSRSEQKQARDVKPHGSVGSG
jgi:hypothetical protein